MVKNNSSLGKRIGGGMIDVIVLSIFFVFYGYFFGQVNNYNIRVEGFSALVFFVLGFSYFIVLEKVAGKTVGKYLLGMRVVDEDGNNISWGKSLGRNLLRFVDGFFFYLVGIIVIAVSDENQRVGDLASLTYVIDEK